MESKTTFPTVSWIAIFVMLLTMAINFEVRAADADSSLGYPDFLELVRNKQIKSAILQQGQGGTEIWAVTTDDRKVKTIATYLDRGLVGDLINNGVKFDVKSREEGSSLTASLMNWGPMLLMIGIAFLIWCWALIDILKSEFKDGVTKICWLLAAILLPVFGSILYLLFGRATRMRSNDRSMINSNSST
jgi:ATP-dependent Zn protease